MSFWTILHLAAIVPALVIGPWVLFRQKGDPWHKALGRVWVVLMVTGLRAARTGKIRLHQRRMVGSYMGLLIAFAFTLRPGRILGDWVRTLLP